jgi:hypothetical protein
MTTCDYCGGPGASALTDMGDVICDPCLLGRPPVAPTHEARAAEVWSLCGGDEFALRTFIAHLLRQVDELGAGVN